MRPAFAYVFVNAREVCPENEIRNMKMDDYMSATSEAAVVATVFSYELARNAIILIYRSDLAN
jgi:hypothetical protein